MRGLLQGRGGRADAYYPDAYIAARPGLCEIITCGQPSRLGTCAMLQQYVDTINACRAQFMGR
jgi:hypothetical protein